MRVTDDLLAEAKRALEHPTRRRGSTRNQVIATCILQHLVDRIELQDRALDRLTTKIWTHGDQCSSECTPACDEMHTFEPECWLGHRIETSVTGDK